jgi:regulatory protein
VTDLEVSEAEKLQKALGLALAHLNRRERTRAEIRAYLERAGVSEPTAEAALTVLVEDRLVDDERFAEMFVADKRTLEQWGGERIRRGLQERGVDRTIAERAIAAAERAAAELGEQSVSELDRALELLRRRFPEPPRDRRDRDRALGVLLRKGYESELALDALAAHARGD